MLCLVIPAGKWRQALPRSFNAENILHMTFIKALVRRRFFSSRNSRFRRTNDTMEVFEALVGQSPNELWAPQRQQTCVDQVMTSS
jgi:hypothetical protein